MFKKMMMTFSGLCQEIDTGLEARTDLALLSGQLREAGASVRAARMALALAKAQHKQDLAKLERIQKTITDLEERTRDALFKGDETLAREGAEAIAALENEHSALITSSRQFESDLRNLQENFRQAASRLHALERGRRTAQVRERIQSTSAATASPAPIFQAEETMERIRERQEQTFLTEEALAGLSVSGCPNALVRRLADAGHGAPQKSSADAVLKRLATEKSPSPTNFPEKRT